MRGSATLEAFIPSPTSPPLMNDFDSLDVFSQRLDQPSLSLADRRDHFRQRGLGKQKKGVALIHSLVKISISLRKM